MLNLRGKINPFGSRLIFWNIIGLIIIKLAFSYSAFQLATLLNVVPPFDSREIIYITNEARKANGLSELETNFELDVAANKKLMDMAEKEYFAHTSPLGIDPWFWFKDSNYKYLYAGENLAIGFITAEDTVNAWLESPSHRANLLNPNYNEIGVAVANVKIEDVKGILIVQHFGKQLANPLSAVQNPITPVIAHASEETPVPQLIKPLSTTVPTEKPIDTQGVQAFASPMKEPPTKLQYVSTDNSIPPVIRIQNVTSKKGMEEFKKWSDFFNNIYALYALFIAILSFIFLVLHEKTRSMAFKTTLNFAIFTSALFIPTAGVAISGLIF